MTQAEHFMQEILDQEKELQFPRFSNEDAMTIGLDLYETAKKNRLPVSIDITRGRQQLFHAVLPGANPDNDLWIQRKNNVVRHFEHSSLYIFNELESEGKTIEERYCFDPGEFGAYGGSFPIIIKDTGVIGTIAVSGLSQNEDHMLVINAIRRFLSKKTFRSDM